MRHRLAATLRRLANRLEPEKPVVWYASTATTTAPNGIYYGTHNTRLGFTYGTSRRY